MSCESHRNLGIDMIKTIAVIFVINVHFFLHTSYYTTAIADGNMFVQSVLGGIFFSCVPLFVLSTGFLMYKKTTSKQYFFKLTHILAVYVTISIICLIFNAFYLHTHYTVQTAVFSIFNFAADGYAWYVNMYLGLYLIIPFINIVLNSIDRKTYHILIGISVFLVAVPTTFNPVFTSKPFLSIIYFPDWWQALYPIMYYMIGAYIGKYQPKVNRKLCAFVILLMPIIQTLLSIWVQQPKIDNTILADYSSMFVVIQSVAIFLALYHVDCKSSAIRIVFKKISSLTLEIYLLSFLADTVLYTNLKSTHLTQQEVFQHYYLIIVPVCIICSILLAITYRFLYDRAIMLIGFIKNGIVKKNCNTSV